MPESESTRQQPLDLHSVVDALRDNLDDEPQTTGQQELAALGLIVAFLGVFAWLWSNDQNPPSTVAERLELRVQQSVTTTENSWIAVALTRALKAELEAGKDVRVHADGIASQVLGGPVLPQPATANSVLETRGTTQNLFIAVRPPTAGSKSLLIDYQLSNAAGQSHSGSLTGRVDMLADLASRTNVELRNKLQLAPAPSTTKNAAQRELPANLRAQELLFSAQEKLSRQQFREALDQLETANELEPEHPILLQTLASAYAGLGYEHKASSYYAAAVANITDLSRERQLSIRAAAHIARQEWPQAQELLRALFLLFPAELNYGLQLARVQTTASDFQAAHQTLDQLRQLPEGLGEDPRIDLHAANAEYANGSWSAALPHARRALVKAEALEADGLEAMARWWLNRLDDDPNESHIKRAVELFGKHNNTDGVIACLTRMGTRARARGDLRGAEKHYTQALALARSTGNDSRLTTTLGTLAIVKDLQGELQSGLQMKQEVLKRRQRRGNQTGIGISMENLGISNYKLGNVTTARQWFNEAGAQFERANDAIGKAWLPWHEGRLLLLEGKVTEANAAMQMAMHNARDRPEGSYVLHVRYELLLLRYLAGIPAGKEEDLIADLNALRQDYVNVDLLSDAAQVQLLQARVTHHIGDLHSSEQLAREAYTTFDAEGINDYRLQAATHLVRLGNAEYCAELLNDAPQTEHQPTGLLAMLATYQCSGSDVNLEQIKQAAEQKNLFEPLWLATHLQNAEDAATMAQLSGWRIRPWLN